MCQLKKEIQKNKIRKGYGIVVRDGAILAYMPFRLA